MIREGLFFFSAFSGATIDLNAGVLRGVSVITEGEAKGHKLQIDATTLSQVKAAADQFANGVKVKRDHESGFNDIVGSIRNFRIEGQQLRGDLHLLKSHDAYDHILELAQTIPDTFGLSIAFSGKSEKKDGQKFARCTELYSIDLVDQPAANPSGLFTEGNKGNEEELDSQEPAMEKNKFFAAIKKFFATPEGKELAQELALPSPTEPDPTADALKRLSVAEGAAATAQAVANANLARAEKAEKELAEKATLLATANDKITKLEAAQADFDAKVKTAADLQVTTQLAAMGLKRPVTTKPDPAAGEKTLLDEFNAATPQKRAELYQFHGMENILRNKRVEALKR